MSAGKTKTSGLFIKWLIILLVSGSVLGCQAKAEQYMSGTLERDRYELIAEAQEPITEIPVREGQDVQAGELLVQLDETRFKARLAQEEAKCDKAKARLAELVRGPRRELIGEARARLHGAESPLRDARHDLERAQALFKQEVSPKATLDRAKARYGEAFSQRNEARAALERLLDGTTDEELKQARAVLAEADARLQEVQVRMKRLQVRAPLVGRIDALPFEVGERPPAGGVVAILLGGPAPYARIYVPEPVRAHIRPGLAATIWVDGVKRRFAGRVRMVSSEAAFTPFFALTEHDRSRLTYIAKVDLIDSDARTLPTGLPVRVAFQLNRNLR